MVLISASNGLNKLILWKREWKKEAQYIVTFRFVRSLVVHRSTITMRRLLVINSSIGSNFLVSFFQDTTLSKGFISNRRTSMFNSHEKTSEFNLLHVFLFILSFWYSYMTWLYIIFFRSLLQAFRYSIDDDSPSVNTKSDKFSTIHSPTIFISFQLFHVEKLSRNFHNKSIDSWMFESRWRTVNYTVIYSEKNLFSNVYEILKKISQNFRKFETIFHFLFPEG